MIQTRPQTQRQTPISVYDGVLDALPPKLRNALLGVGITSLAQADALPDAALMRIRWIGPETVRYLRALAHHAPIDHGPMEARDAEELRRYAGAIAGDIARGRLSPDLTVRTIHGPMTMDALTERWEESAHCAAEDLNLARALAHALRYGALDALLALFGAHHFPRTRTAIHLAAARIAAGDSLRAVADDLAARASPV